MTETKYVKVYMGIYSKCSICKENLNGGDEAYLKEVTDDKHRKMTIGRVMCPKCAEEDKEGIYGTRKTEIYK